MSVDAQALPTLRVDQVGSLLRPSWLIEAYHRHARGEATDAELREAQGLSVSEVIAKQEARGLPIITDGEHWRAHFRESFSASVTGYAAEGTPLTDRLPMAERLRFVKNQPLEEFRFTKRVAHNTIKVTLLGLDRIIQRFAWERSQAVYSEIDDFVADVVAIERRIVEELVAEGCHYVQIDAPGYTAYLDPGLAAPMLERGESIQENVARSLRADNAVIEGITGVTFGIHICRGNKPGGYHGSGSYEAIAEEMFNTLKHHRFLLEYDTERAGGFEPLRFVPPGKMVVLGLLSTKVPEVETEDYSVPRKLDRPIS